MVVCPTPETTFSRWVMIWSAIVVISARLRVGEETAMERIGASSGLNRVICGVSTSSGKPASSAETRSRTSCAAPLESTSRLNSTMTSERPSKDSDVTALTPPIVLTASSMSRVTLLSIVSGAAPV